MFLAKNAGSDGDFGMKTAINTGGGLVSGQFRFLCPECQTIQPLEGRKRRTPHGFRCGQCAAKRGTPLKLKRPEPTEAQVLAAVKGALSVHKSVAWFERMNSGAGRLDRGNGHSGQFMRFGFKGCPDIIGQLKDGRALFVEVKRPSGKPTPEQQVFLDMASDNGACAFVARSADDVFTAIGQFSTGKEKPASQAGKPQRVSQITEQV